MKAYTDYPFEFLGDIAGEEAPIREIEVLFYDGDKRLTVVVEGVTTQVKRGYVYKTPSTCGEGETLDTQYVKNNKGHFPSAKAAQITKSWVVYSPIKGSSPMYYKFLKDAWNKAKSLGFGSYCTQSLKIRRKDGSGTWTSGAVGYEVVGK